MSKAVWHYPTACIALQRVITYRRRRGNSFLKIAGLKKVALRTRIMTPDSSKTICLQLLPD